MKLTMYIRKYLRPAAKIVLCNKADGVILYEGYVKDISWSEIRNLKLLDIISIDSNGCMMLLVGEIQ